MLLSASFSSCRASEVLGLPSDDEPPLDSGCRPRSDSSPPLCATVASMLPLRFSSSERAINRGPSKLPRLFLKVTRRLGVAVPDDCPDASLGRSGLGALLGAAVESAVTGIDGIGDQSAGVEGSPSLYSDNLEAFLRIGLGARLDAAVESAVGVKADNFGVENPVPASDNDSLDPRATWRCTLIDVLWRVSKSVIHCATGNRWTEDRARINARVSWGEDKADSIADLN